MAWGPISQENTFQLNWSIMKSLHRLIKRFTAKNKSKDGAGRKRKRLSQVKLISCQNFQNVKMNLTIKIGSGNNCHFDFAQWPFSEVSAAERSRSQWQPTKMDLRKSFRLRSMTIFGSLGGWAEPKPVITNEDGFEKIISTSFNDQFSEVSVAERSRSQWQPTKMDLKKSFRLRSMTNFRKSRWVSGAEAKGVIFNITLSHAANNSAIFQYKPPYLPESGFQSA